MESKQLLSLQELSHSSKENTKKRQLSRLQLQGLFPRVCEDRADAEIGICQCDRGQNPSAEETHGECWLVQQSGLPRAQSGAGAGNGLSSL